MRIIALLPAVALVSACNLPMGEFRIDPTGSATSFELPVAISGTCGATGKQGLLNQPESALASMSLPTNTRIIRPGTRVTKEANPARLNIGIAANGTIVHVACG